MASNRFQMKRTNIAGRVPNTTNSSNSSYIAAGEFALNMVDRKLYTSDGTRLITIGTSLGDLTGSDIINIGEIATKLTSINSTSIFTGNVSVNTSVNTTSITVQNPSGNSSITPLSIYVGSETANIILDSIGGLKTINISSANISTTGIATIQTQINHGITLLTQTKVFVNTSHNSLNTANYSADYNPSGFNITAVPSPNSISFTLPTDNYKYKWGDRSIQNIYRGAGGLVTVVTKGSHNYESGDKAYVTNVNYKKAPFSELVSGVPTSYTIAVIDNVTATYTQSNYNSNPISLNGAILSLENSVVKDTLTSTYPVYLNIRAPASVFSNYSIGSEIIFNNFPVLTSTANVKNIKKSPSDFNKTHVIVDKVFNEEIGAQTVTVKIKVFSRSDAQVINNINYVFARPPDTTSTSYTVPDGSSGSIGVDFVEYGTTTNLSQLCPVLPTTLMNGTIDAVRPVGVVIKNEDKLVTVYDKGVFVGNTTVGNIIDAGGSRTFKPSG